MSETALTNARLAAIEACEVLDTPREQMFDNVVFTVAQMFRAPMAALILVGDGRFWSKSDVGPLALNWTRAVLLCQEVLDSGEALVVENAQADARFAGAFEVSPDQAGNFCAAVPVIGPGKHRVGALCVLDSQLRPVPKRQLMHFNQLAEQAGDLLRLRIAGLDLEEFRTSRAH